MSAAFPCATAEREGRKHPAPARPGHRALWQLSGATGLILLIVAALAACGDDSQPDLVTSNPTPAATQQPELPTPTSTTVATREPTPTAQPDQEPPQSTPAGQSDPHLAQSVMEQLQDRSFRQFEPGRDSSPRKAVVIDFFNGISVWAQYSENNHALSEWEIFAQEFEAQVAGNGSDITLTPINPHSTQIQPETCDDCVDPAGFSVSIRGLFDSTDIAIMLHDPSGTLPSPMPVFTQWTPFQEDEYFD